MLTAAKAGVIGGKSYEVGEAVDDSNLESGKVQQLVAQRVLRDSLSSSPKACIVLRDCRIRGKEFKKGTRVAVARLSPDKVSQMLDHRILGLAPPA